MTYWIDIETVKKSIAWKRVKITYRGRQLNLQQKIEWCNKVRAMPGVLETDFNTSRNYFVITIHEEFRYIKRFRNELDKLTRDIVTASKK